MEKREGYYDYMTRRLREDTSKMSLIEKDMAGLTESHYNVLKHLKDEVLLQLAIHQDSQLKHLAKYETKIYFLHYL